MIGKDTHNTYQRKCWTKEGERLTEVFASHKARVAHEVHALFLVWHSRVEDVRYDDDDF